VQRNPVDIFNHHGAFIRGNEPRAFEVAGSQKLQKPAFVLQPRAAINARGVLSYAAPGGLDDVCICEILASSEKGVALRRRLQPAKQKITATANGQLALACRLRTFDWRRRPRRLYSIKAARIGHECAVGVAHGRMIKTMRIRDARAGFESAERNVDRAVCRRRRSVKISGASSDCHI
jgi:hypothetical protein